MISAMMEEVQGDIGASMGGTSFDLRVGEVML